MSDQLQESQPSRAPASRKWTLLLLALLLVGGAATAAFFLFPGDAQAGEVFLLPAASVGPDPFSETPLATPPDPSLATPAAESTEPLRPASDAPVEATSGARPGLYGGTRNQAACDPDQMVRFLQNNPQKAQAWVAALDADPAVSLSDGRSLTPETIPEYVAGLTSIVLMEDTRATNHGYRNGRATQLQSVLQKGSAVLVDDRGVPRVRCYCGNPLLPPVPTTQKTVYQGPRWSDFDPNNVDVIHPSPEPIRSFTVRDPNNPETTFQIPPGAPLSYIPLPPRRPTVPGGEDPAPLANDPNDCSDGSCEDDDEAYRRLEEAYDDPNDCSDGGCEDDAEAYRALEEATSAQQCSPSDEASPSSLRIENHASYPVSLSWYDFECNKVFYSTIPSGGSTVQDSYVGHRWAIGGAESDVVFKTFSVGAGSSWTYRYTD